ncbi:hypothetical protein [uncultured Lutibacter sp.]|uniref:hypothetical protein n=1 Tax=uncultured Lutibacter sp. TaxID=437739 RepID=UPI0026216EFC|nr:hypothetical protein [uncultured Lutibacter sp.]
MGIIGDNFRRGFDIEIPLTESELKSREIANGYFSNLTDKDKKPLEKMDLSLLKMLFKETFEYVTRTKLLVNKDNSVIYDIIARYFAKDESFNETKLSLNIADLSKGLLIIGDYGCGKTTMIETYQRIAYKLLPETLLWFNKTSCLTVVSEYETLDSKEQWQKEEFNNKYYNTKTYYFDDFGTEQDASNFGKKNLMKEIIEERYARGKKTYLTTNLTLAQIKVKYGDRVFDRLQEMFNIFEMKGKSFRK